MSYKLCVGEDVEIIDPIYRHRGTRGRIYAEPEGMGTLYVVEWEGKPFAKHGGTCLYAEQMRPINEVRSQSIHEIVLEQELYQMREQISQLHIKLSRLETDNDVLTRALKMRDKHTSKDFDKLDPTGILRIWEDEDNENQ